MDAPHPDPELLAWSRWALHRRRRVPLALSAAFSVALAIYIALVGRGIRWLERRLPEYEAALAATARPPVPPEENAAPLWHEAFAAMRGWGAPEDDAGDEDGDEDGDGDGDGEDLSVIDPPPDDPLELWPGGMRSGQEAVSPPAPGAPLFADDGPLARHVARNQAAIEAALRAAARERCDWGDSPFKFLEDLWAPVKQDDEEEDEEDPPPSRLKQTLELAMVLGRALVLEAARGRWEESAAMWRAILTLGRHTAEGIRVIDFIAAQGLGALGDRVLQQAIASAPAPPPAALLASLVTDTRRRLERLPPASRALQSAQAHSRLLFARVFSRRALPVDPRAWNGASELEISPLLLPLAAASELSSRWYDVHAGKLMREADDLEERGMSPTHPGREAFYARRPIDALVILAALSIGTEAMILRDHADEIGRARSMHVALAALARRLERGSWPARIEDALDDLALARDPWLPDGLLSYEVEGDALAVGTVGLKGKFRHPSRQPRKHLNEEALRHAVLVAPPPAWWEAGR